MKVTRKGTERQKTELLARVEDFKIFEEEGGFIKETR